MTKVIIVDTQAGAVRLPFKELASNVVIEECHLASIAANQILVWLQRGALTYPVYVTYLQEPQVLIRNAEELDAWKKAHPEETES
jgi:hypothetical protein